MKAISLWQPWATLMALGEKWIETRHWPTKYRGDLLIHAAKRHSQEQIDYCLSEPCRSILAKHGIKPEMRDVASFHADQLPLGCIVAARYLVDCRPVRDRVCSWRAVWNETREIYWALPPAEPELSFGNYEVGRFGWRMVEGFRFEMPIPYRGAQGFFDVPDELVLPAIKAATAKLQDSRKGEFS